MQISIQTQIRILITLHGSGRKTAKALGIEQSYLNRLMREEKLNPGAETLKKLGLRKVIVYEVIAAATC